MKYILKHWITSGLGFALGLAQYYVASTPTGKYAAALTVVLGFIAKDFNKS